MKFTKAFITIFAICTTFTLNSFALTDIELEPVKGTLACLNDINNPTSDRLDFETAFVFDFNTNKSPATLFQAGLYDETQTQIIPEGIKHHIYAVKAVDESKGVFTLTTGFSPENDGDRRNHFTLDMASKALKLEIVMNEVVAATFEMSCFEVQNLEIKK